MSDTKTILIAGREFTVPFKYAEGHTLSAIEAKVLNQTRFENLRNNFAKTVKDSLAGAEGAVAEAELDAKFAEYEADYEFATPGTGGSTKSLDPIEKEAFVLATALVKEKMASLGRTWNPPKEASDDEKAAYKATRDEKVAEIAGRDEVVAQARKNVAARDKGMSALAGAIDL